MKYASWFTSFFPFSEPFCLKKQVQWPWTQLSAQEPQSYCLSAGFLACCHCLAQGCSTGLHTGIARRPLKESLCPGPEILVSLIWAAAQNSPGYSHVQLRVRLFSRTTGTEGQLPGSRMFLTVFQFKTISKHIPFMEACFCSRGRRKAGFCTCGEAAACCGTHSSGGLTSCRPSLHTCYSSTPSHSFCWFLPSPGYIIQCFMDWSVVPGPVLIDTPEASARAVLVPWRQSGGSETVGSGRDWRTSVCVPACWHSNAGIC